ncbi:protein-disulfide reductase DsbD family protein [Marinicella meishanensis]|uniref:protein-disulfide reductase DsbD family protein n=1 Tax=Marinicella meishanensis TaxID=2873263 RepID=UPI001CC0F40A|nr:protein-disulfide reductase DsbD domain-containing protein [Marinicella sp. NBU2979]
MKKLMAWWLVFGWVWAAAQAAEQQVQIELISDQTQVEAGQTITVGLVQIIAPKWHVYWINPGDSGEAIDVSWSGLNGLSSAAIQWPVPHKIPFGPLTNYGYEDQVTLLQDLTLPAPLPAGPIELVADIAILVCEEICIPEFHQAQLVLNGDQAAAPEAIQQARDRLPIQRPWDATYAQVGDEVLLQVTPGEAELPLAHMHDIELFFTGRGMVNHSASASSDLANGLWRLRQTTGDVAVHTVPTAAVIIAYQDPSGQRQGIELAARYAAAAPPMVKSSLVWAMGLALLGGLILNAMPCVFPVLALKSLSLVQMQDASSVQASRHGWAYTAGVVVSFLLVALVLMALKSAGAQIGWGFQLQNPLFVLFLIYLLTAVALNLAGFFEIGGGLVGLGSQWANRSGLSGSFYTGILATLVATPCTAPFMGVAIGYALVQPWYASSAVFLALGFGLALPFLLLSLFPRLRGWLPKPGPWMARFKEFLAFPMLATVAWLIWVLSQQAGSTAVLLVLMGLVVLAMGLWLRRNTQRWRVAAWLVLLLSLAPFYAMHRLNADPDQAPNWQPFNASSYQQALNNPAPVFVNMTAAWCITCQVNEQVALNTTATQSLFLTEKVQYLKGDWTNFDAEITRYLEQYQRNGVPLYVYYGPKEATTGARPAPQVLPQLLTPAIIAEHVAIDRRP